jgi:benzaldehyde dehydrogenase (NAD)
MNLLESKTWEGQVYSGGWTASQGGDIAVIEPATGEELGRAGVANAADVARAAAAAREAQPAWAATNFEQRAAVLRRAGDLIERNSDEIQRWIVRETGAVPGLAGFAVGVAAQECYEAAALASRPLGEILPSNQPRLSLLRRVPVGVVGVISPFNVPLILSCRSVAPALALGNAVVLKPDVRTPVVGGFVFARVFEEAGLPAGLLHVLPGGSEAGSALVTDPQIRLVSFTGSTADIDAAGSAGAWGSFLHQGQICMTAGRHLVQSSVADAYVSALAEHAAHLPVGNPAAEQVALGPLIDEAQRDKVHALVTSSVDAGARLAAGGGYDRLYYQPTVLDDVRTDMPAYAQEVFGPVAPVVRFATEDDAVKLAADSGYGLSLSILTGNAMRGLAMAERIPTGIVHINDQTVNDEAVAPFGGVLDSGTGARFGGQANLDAFTDQRWITLRGDIPGYPF